MLFGFLKKYHIQPFQAVPYIPSADQHLVPTDDLEYHPLNTDSGTESNEDF